MIFSNESAGLEASGSGCHATAARHSMGFPAVEEVNRRAVAAVTDLERERKRSMVKMPLRAAASLAIHGYPRRPSCRGPPSELQRRAPGRLAADGHLHGLPAMSALVEEQKWEHEIDAEINENRRF